jgi:hypothetical protein
MAGIGQLLSDKLSISSLTLLMLILIFFIMVYQVFEKKRTRENFSRKGSGNFRSPNK